MSSEYSMKDRIRQKMNKKHFLLLEVGFFMLALVPRWPLLFLHDGQCDAQSTISKTQHWFATGQYVQRWPGSAIYDLIVGLLDRVTTSFGLPYFYATNLFSVLCVFISLSLLYRVFRAYCSIPVALLVVTAFNFHPQELVIGASTYEMNLMMVLGTASFYLYQEAKIRWSVAFAILATGVKLYAASIAIPLSLILLAREYKKSEKKYFAMNAVVIVAGVFLVFLPSIISDAYGFFGHFLTKQTYHPEISRVARAGAFVHRAFNSMGPAGVVLLLWALWRNRFYLKESKSEQGFLLWSFCGILLFLNFLEPWETYYLLPIFPLAIFIVVTSSIPQVARALFIGSLLLPIFIQVQFKPWKWPPYAIRAGIWQAHIDRDWNAAGGG